VLNEGEGAAIYNKAFLIRSILAHGVYAPTSSCLSRWLGCIHSMLLTKKKKKLDFDPDFFSFRDPTSCISLTASYCGLKFYFFIFVSVLGSCKIFVLQLSSLPNQRLCQDLSNDISFASFRGHLIIICPFFIFSIYLVRFNSDQGL
jgi:hypothetical protein